MPTRQVEASVIIPAWNGREFLPDCLDAVLAQEGVQFEVLVVDDHSPDDSADLVSRHYPQVRLLRNEHNLGFAGACNVGLRAARGAILVLLNQDTVVRPGWLAALVRMFDAERVGVVGCKILYPDGQTVQHAGGWIEWPLGLTYHYGHHEPDDGRWDEPRPVDFVTGASMALRRSVLDTVGLLDEGFWPGYFEDTDFCVRAGQAGYEVWYTPEAVLVHQESGAQRDPRERWEAHHRGRLRFVLKHLPPERFLAQFGPAEERHQPSLIAELGSRPLCRAYLEAIAQSPAVLRRSWQADEPTIREIVRLLQRLHSRAWNAEWQGVKERVTAEMEAFVSQVTAELEAESPPTGGDSVHTEVFEPPALTEYEFHSETPIIGPLVARLRDAWYGVAARWAIRHLLRQQNEINQRQAMLNRQQEEVNRRQQEVNRQQEEVNWQQEMVNRRQAMAIRKQEAMLERYLTAMENKLLDLADENALLAAKIAEWSGEDRSGH